MRIGIDIRGAQLGSGTRGIGKYIYDLVEGLAGYAPENEYVLIAFPERPLPPRLSKLPACCRVATLSTQLLGPYSVTQPVRYLWRWRYLRQRRRQTAALTKLAVRERLDVLHLPRVLDQDYFPDVSLVCRVVKTFHDATPNVLSEYYLDRWPEAQRFVYRLQMRSYQRADLVVAISESARQDAIKVADINPEKICVVYNSVSEEFQPVTDQKRLDECLGRYHIGNPYFLYCSAVDHSKNIPRLLEAFAKFCHSATKPYQLVMVCEKSEAIASQAFDLGLSREQLLFTGFVSDRDLVALYSGALALLSPSLYEGFGLPAGQAMRAGTPVIASDRSAQPEVVGDAGLLVDPYDVDAIADALRLLGSDAALRAELSVRARKQVTKFDLSHHIQAMLKAYGAEAAVKVPIRDQEANRVELRA